MQGDLDGDGHPERVYLTKEGLVRIVSDSGTELFQAQLPSKAAVGVAMERVPVSDQVSLLHIHWRWCLRDYPANVFIWFNRQTGHFETDRGAEGVAYTCGMYEHQGQGRFNILARNDDFVYKANVHWQDGQFTRETSVTEVLYVQLDRLPIVLSQLGETDVDNPGRLFDSPDLYKQFKSKVGKAWRFQPGASKAANTLELQATSTDGESHGTLSVSYRVQGAFKENIVITGLTWSPD